MIMRFVGSASFLLAAGCLGLGVYCPGSLREGLLLAQAWLVLAIWATGQVILVEVRKK